jgi:hypothetical protein
MSLQTFTRQQVIRDSVFSMAGKRAEGNRLNTNLDVYLRDKYPINGTKYMDDIAFSARMKGKGMYSCSCPGACMCK